MEFGLGHEEDATMGGGILAWLDGFGTDDGEVEAGQTAELVARADGRGGGGRCRPIAQLHVAGTLAGEQWAEAAEKGERAVRGEHGGGL